MGHVPLLKNGSAFCEEFPSLQKKGMVDQRRRTNSDVTRIKDNLDKVLAEASGSPSYKLPSIRMEISRTSQEERTGFL